MESALRILHVVEEMKNGEKEAFLMNVYRKINRKKIQFDFLTTGDGELDNEIRQLGGHIYRIPSLSEGYLAHKRSLRQFFKKHRFYIVVHSHLDQWSTFALREARRVGIPVRVAHSYQNANDGSWSLKMRKNIVGLFILFLATDYFACSTDAAKWLFKWKAEKAVLMRNAIDLERFCYSKSTREEMRAHLLLTEREFVIGHVGEMTKQKNHSYLLDLFIAFRRRIPQARLVLVGDGPLQREIEEKIDQYKIKEYVHILNNEENQWQWIQAFDVFVYPSLYDGFSTSLIEAQGTGVPILASDTVTKEVDMGYQLIDYISIEEKLLWLEKIERIYSERKRIQVNQATLLESGFELKNLAHETEQRYLELRDERI